ncbi:DinB family protein [bacterium AH-315-P13]|nr:DinB family protein [bacterium AH-315-P13]
MNKLSFIILLIVCHLSVNAQLEIKAEKGFTPQIGVIVSMLNDMSNRVERTVKDLSVAEIDFLLDENANSIGALIMHLAATEKFYQVYTFENRELNKDEEEWSIAMSMGKKTQEKYNGKDVKHYLEVFKKVRKKTLEYLKERDDEWLSQVPEGYRMNNHWAWFHVMEHQSSHLGQILLLKKRIPK